MTPTPPPNPISDVEAARQAARRVRAEWLHAIATGVVTPLEAIRSAEGPDGGPVRDMSLRTVLMAAYSRPRTEDIMAKLGRTSGCRLAGRYVPVRWLMDQRSPGRLEALATLLGEVHMEPERFPYAHRA
jgi:hypothetical protein